MHLINSIEANNHIDLIKNIDQFKERGLVKFENLLSIPVADRLPGLVEKYGKEKIHGLLVVLLTDFANSFNLIRPMTADQIVYCSFDMIDSSYEDHLSIEDFTIFFQGAKSAKYGKILDRMDQQTIFELFENYRQERHKKFKTIQEEKNMQYRGAGSMARISEEREDLAELRSIMCDMYKKDVIKNNTGEGQSKN